MAGITDYIRIRKCRQEKKKKIGVQRKGEHGERSKRVEQEYGREEMETNNEKNMKVNER